ncbi:hypothetical protein BJY16_002153 [Actinoplanes octamycinicus]|uniref:HAF family extracellular repeat protein n=1 Tax=Actinoplanes octamycinicus TaxID=135948 RepID=A0A7W7M6D7_9ACTN|nr:hypothetical protein [Actinoplanes octamycinicus]MBB4738694.1 hypothetical protein [Actinoplanes octamycinicus]GIE61427.1 hypothetical protein Aoc01nite_68290 [Actinoplanes octamycinicus]
MTSDFDLLRPLDTEPRTASTVDIERAIADGRRQRTRRGAGYAGAALTFVAVTGVTIAAGALRHDASHPPAPGTGVAASRGATTSAPAAPAVPVPASCTVQRLTAPKKAPMALIGGADSSGSYFVGRSYPKSGGYQAVIWHDGAGTEVPLPGDEEESLIDVNASGTAVGWSYVQQKQVPFVYHDGQVSRLAGVAEGSADAINDRGTIVGDDGSGHPLLWSSATAQPQRLPVPAGATSAGASDIDEDGTVIGTIDYKTPYVWLPDGSHHALKVPDLQGKPAEGRAFHISGGWVIGVVNEAGTGKDAGKVRARAKMVTARWNLRTGEAQLFEGFGGTPDAVNAQGWFTGVDQQAGAVLLAGASTVKLPGLAPRGVDGLADIANTVSTDGRTIGGQSNDKDGVIQPVVWHCK